MDKGSMPAFNRQQLQMEEKLLKNLMNDMQYRMSVLKKEEGILYEMMCREESEKLKKTSDIKMEIISSDSEAETTQNQTGMACDLNNSSPEFNSFPEKKMKTFHCPEDKSTTDNTLEELDLSVSVYAEPKVEEEEEEDGDDFQDPDMD